MLQVNYKIAKASFQDQVGERGMLATETYFKQHDNKEIIFIDWLRNSAFWLADRLLIEDSYTST